MFQDGLFGDCGAVLASRRATPRDSVLRIHTGGEGLISLAELPDVITRATPNRKLVLHVKWGKMMGDVITGMLDDLKKDVATGDVVGKLDNDAHGLGAWEKACWAASLGPATCDDLNKLRALSDSTSGASFMVSFRPDQKQQREDVFQALSRWLVKWYSMPTIIGKDAARAVVGKLFSKRVYNAIRLAKNVDHLPLLLMVNRAHSTVCADAPSIIKEYNTITNEVNCLKDWKGLGARLGIDEDELGNLWVFASKWMCTNSNLRMLTGGGAGGSGRPGYSENPIIAYLEQPTTWADRVEAADGDGVNLFFRLPAHLLALFPTAGVAFSSAMSLDAAGCLKVVGRVVCIDAPEWKQPYLVAKRMLMYLVEPRRNGGVAVCSVRMTQAYYANNGRVFAEFAITAARRPTVTATDQRAAATAPMASSPPTPTPTHEVSLHILLLAAGAVYLMPQYFWCRTREHLELAIGVYGDARRRAVEKRILVDSSDQDQSATITHLTEAWKHSFTSHSTLAPGSKNVMEQRLDAFLVQLARDDMPPLNTVDAVMTALGDDWHTEVFNVHMLESVGDKPVTLSTARVLDSLTSGSETQELAWWKYPRDPESFNSTMVWGKPHHVKSRQ